MLISTSNITSRYSEGLGYLAHASYDRFVKDLYALQYKKNRNGEKLLLLLHALNSWSNHEGATNAFTSKQLMGIMDNIKKLRQSGPSGGVLGQTASTSANSLFILDSSSVNLSLSNNLLEASVKLSSVSGNRLLIKSDGLYVSAADTGGTTQTILLITGADFTDNNTYNNASMLGADVQIWHRGMGFLLFNPNDPDDETNEFSLVPTGGFVITIPDFNVNAGTNYFYIILNTT